MIRTFRFRLTAWYVGFFAALQVLFCVFCYHLLARSLEARVEQKLAAQATTAASLLEDEIREAGGDVPKAATEVVQDMRLDGSAEETEARIGRGMWQASACGRPASWDGGVTVSVTTP